MRIHRKNTPAIRHSLDNQNFKNILKQTRFEENELRQVLRVYNKFAEQNEDKRYMIREQLLDILYIILGISDNTMLHRIMFVMDPNSLRVVNRLAWAKFLSLLLKGTLEERIVFCFKVYDVYERKYLTKDDILMHIMKTIISTETEEEAEILAFDMSEFLVKRMDIDRNGVISFHDYRLSVLKAPELLECFGRCFPPHFALQTMELLFSNVNIQFLKGHPIFSL